MKKGRPYVEKIYIRSALLFRVLIRLLSNSLALIRWLRPKAAVRFLSLNLCAVCVYYFSRKLPVCCLSIHKPATYVLRITRLQLNFLFSLKDFAGGATALNRTLNLSLNPLVKGKRLSEGLRARLRGEALRNLHVWLRPYGCDTYCVCITYYVSATSI
jgi:hypothetical protein